MKTLVRIRCMISNGQRVLAHGLLVCAAILLLANSPSVLHHVTFTSSGVIIAVSLPDVNDNNEVAPHDRALNCHFSAGCMLAAILAPAETPRSHIELARATGRIDQLPCGRLLTPLTKPPIA